MKMILKKPIVTEKTTNMAGKYAFIVDKDANKIEIKKAVEEMYNSRVEKVSTMNYLGKSKRVGRYLGKKSNFKKAIVTLKEGEKIEFFEA